MKQVLAALGIDWSRLCIGVQLLFFCHIAFHFVGAITGDRGREGMWFFFGLALVWLIAATVATELTRGGVREYLALLFISVNPFIIPLALYCNGATVSTAALMSAIYILIVVAITPLFVSVTAVVAATVLLWAARSYLVELDGPISAAAFGRNAAACIGLAGVGLLWRVLISKLYDRLSAGAPLQPIEEPLPKTDDNTSRLATENALLREEIALHIVEVRELMATVKQRNS